MIYHLKLRHYPKDFGTKLAQLVAGKLPEADLRNKQEVDMSLSDRELFAKMSIHDAWWDANIPELYWYLRKLPKLKIPESWETTIDQFEMELQEESCFNSFLDDWMIDYSNVGMLLPLPSSWPLPTHASPTS